MKNSGAHDIAAALASLEARWGAAAPRRLGGAGSTVGAVDPLGRSGMIGEVVGALATVPRPEAMPLPERSGSPVPGVSRAAGVPFERPAEGAIVRTGFAALDAILGRGGLPRQASIAVRGGLTSGKTTLALRLAAEAQASGSIVAWLDLARSFDPVEAVARGVRLDRLVILTPDSIDDGLAMAGALVQGRAVDLLLLDLPTGQPASGPGRLPPGRPGSGPGRPSGGRAPTIAERFQRLAALARRTATTLVVLEPSDLPSSLRQALGESTALQLDLVRRAWIRLGRDVTGQRTEVIVARSRFGPPGRRTELRILYADGGDRDACLGRDRLLGPDRVAIWPAGEPDGQVSPDLSDHLPRTISNAPPPPLLASSPAPAGPASAGRLRLVSERPDHPGRAALGRGNGSRPQPGRRRLGGPARDATRDRPPARA